MEITAVGIIAATLIHRRRQQQSLSPQSNPKPLLIFGTTRATNNPPWIDPILIWLKDGPPNLTPPNSTSIQVVPLGQPTRLLHFSDLNPSFPSFLNHGSYGSALTIATKSAQHWKYQLEKQPVQFMESIVLPELVDTIRQVSQLIGESDPINTVALVPNATYAVNSVARSVIVSSNYVQKNDVVLCLTKSYGACVSALDLACRDKGAQLVRLDLSYINETYYDDDDVLDRLTTALISLNGKCKFAMLDLITSVPPRRLPVEKMCDICHQYNVKVLIDAAHGIGNCVLPSQISDLNCDYLTTNLHKWYCTPKGTALLWVRKHKDAIPIYPASVSHGHGRGFSNEFIWAASKDYGKYLSIREAIRWHHAYGGVSKIRSRNQQLIEWGAQRIQDMVPGSRAILPHTNDPNRKLCLCIVELPEQVYIDLVPPSSKCLPSSMEKCHAALQWLKEKKISTVVWDMDHTMSGQHCGDGLEISNLNAYLNAVSEDFVLLSNALAFHNIKQAVATGSDPAEYEIKSRNRCTHVLGPDLATQLIKTKCNERVLKSFEIMVGFYCRIHLNNFLDGDVVVNRKGKRHHMRRIRTFYDETFENMLLIDDSKSSLINEDGWHGMRVQDPNVGFQFSDLLGIDYDYNKCETTSSIGRKDMLDTTTGLIDPMKLHFELRERGCEVVCYRDGESKKLCIRISASSYNMKREYEVLGYRLSELLKK